MKTVELYKCEICEHEYKSGEAARECEAGHKRAEVIEEQEFCKYSPYKEYPERLIVSMEDGKNIEYRLARILE